eukprot:TRINITY_DN3717_c0_g1_i2.p1 TRINITY_DN3717_c0_g1~~TRINITY_DN3717_c0_g1_i2.p1  ORF type:complete len:280 (+),score=44.63 TRINITY_DN3717_c0_g1_i2:92-931(+)
MSMSLLSQPPANLLPLSNLARNPYISTKTRDKRIDFKPKSSDIQGIGIVSSDKSNTIGLGLSVCEIYRRKLLSYAVWWPLSYALTLDPSRALEMDSINADTNFAFQTDEINAYMFAYPLEVPSRHYKLKWIVSRKPERYSSAAPLSADARQRIVSEILDIKDNLVISVSVGPPNDQFLTSKDKSAWNAKNVAESVLSDKSTARLTTGQRVTESSILEAHCNNVAGEPYWYYEHLARKSPTAYCLFGFHINTSVVNRSKQRMSFVMLYLLQLKEKDIYIL